MWSSAPRRGSTCSLLITLALALPSTAIAEETSAALVEELRSEVVELRERLAALEERLEAVLSHATEEEMPSATREPLPGESSGESLLASDKAAYLPSRGWLESMHYGIPRGAVQVHALVDLEYLDAQSDGSRGGVSTFDNHHANLFLRSRIRPNLLAHSEFEFEHGGDGVEVDQAYLEWGINDWVSLTGGRFYTPFGIERFVWYSATNALVSRPEPMRLIAPGNFYANGLMASGALPLKDRLRFVYETSLTDGLGDDALTDRRGSRQTRDNNSSRAVSGRVALALWPGLELGSSFHTQRYSTEGNLDLELLGLDLSGRWRGWELRGEYIHATLDQADDLTNHEESGWYSQLSYAFQWDRQLFPGVSLVTRYDWIDLDKAVKGNDDRRFLSLGFNTEIYRHFRLKGEYRFISEHGEPRDDDEFLGQLVVDF